MCSKMHLCSAVTFLSFDGSVGEAINVKRASPLNKI